MRPLVMIIDDDVALVDELTSILEADGHEVLCAYNGQDGLRALLTLQRAPSVLIVDLHLPVMDGRQVLELVRAYVRLREIPVLVLTGDPEASSLPPHQGLLRKPVSVDTLRAAVRALIERRTTA